MKRLLLWANQIQFFAIILITATVVTGIGILGNWLSPTSLNTPAPNQTQLPAIPPPSATAPSLPTTQPQQPETITFSPAVPATSLPTEQPASEPVPVRALPLVKSHFGHLPYSEDDPSRLEPVGTFVRGTYERIEYADFELNQAFQEMVKAASLEGVALMPISGFRSIADQKVLFEKQVARKGSEEAAAQWSAPPGYSEHHTGYAIDIGDPESDTDLKMSFQDTNAYQWLLTNAVHFGFEESFSPNNSQGVSYEPWHWRYIGSTRAQKIFAVARSF